MASKKVFYKKRKGLPEWTQLYMVWAVILLAASPLVYFCGSQKVDVVEAVRIIHNKNETLAELNSYKGNVQVLTAPGLSALSTYLKINQKILKLKINNLVAAETPNTCSSLALSHQSGSKNGNFLFMSFESKDALIHNRIFLDLWLKNPLSKYQIMLIPSQTCFTAKFLEQIVESEKVSYGIFLINQPEIKSKLVYYGYNFSLPNISLAATLKKIQPFSIWEHILIHFISKDILPHTVLLAAGVNSFSMNQAQLIREFSFPAILDFAEKTVGLMKSSRNDPPQKLWLTSQRQLGNNAIKVFYIFFLILASFPLISRLNNKNQSDFVAALISTFAFGCFFGFYFLLFHFLSFISVGYFLFTLLALVLGLICFFVAKFFERKFLLLKINTFSAYGILFLLNLFLFFGEIQIFIFLLPAIFLLAQVKDSPANVGFLNLLAAVGLSITVILVAASFMFASSLSAKQFYAMLNLDFFRIAVFSFLGGAVLTLTSKNTRPKKYF